MFEESAGCVLIDQDAVPQRALLIRVRSEAFEIPKGHIETGESSEEAALRELHEETGLLSAVLVGPLLGTTEHTVERNGITIPKRVHYFLAIPTAPLSFGPRPRGTRELRWILEEELATVPLVNPDLHAILQWAFQYASKH